MVSFEIPWPYLPTYPGHSLAHSAPGVKGYVQEIQVELADPAILHTCSLHRPKVRQLNLTVLSLKSNLWNL